jgi:hypothetical protein
VDEQEMSAEIIRDSFAEAISAAESGDRKFFVTLTSRRDDRVWIQLRWDNINASFPHSTDPIQLLESVGVHLPSGVTLESWKSNRYATFEHGAFPTEPLVEFVEAYFNKVLGLAPSIFTLEVTRN